MSNCGCHNRGPCQTSQTNTAECESLPSQIKNFTDSFFGEVIKTESNGEVIWNLPCNLEIGLENNQRASGEGLACYFLRLFRDGIVGRTGPAGESGADGANGYNAFTVSILSFTQPTLDSPAATVRVFYNPAIVAGMIVFVQTSGWYEVNENATSGVLYLTLKKALSSPPSTVAAGALIVPAGYQGESITGPQGPVGAQGPVGPAGESFTTANGMYRSESGSDYALQNVSGAISFTTSAPELLLPDVGTYLITATVAIEGETGVAPSDIAAFKLRNTSINDDVPGSDQQVSNIVDAQQLQVVINVTYSTDAANRTVALFGSCTSADMVTAIAARTVLTYVRIG